MQEHVDELARHPDAQRHQALLDRIIASPALHARLVNTFARMEYVGVRKLLKSRRSDKLDLPGLQHILDEAVHALRLKKAAHALAAAAGADPAGIATFSPADTLAGDAGEGYLQGVDQAAEEALADLAPERRAEVNYLLTSAAIEVRAQAFYPLYEQRLRAAGVNMSVAMIMKDEGRHLDEMAEGLDRALPDWRARLVPVLAAERAHFATFVTAVADAAPVTRVAVAS